MPRVLRKEAEENLRALHHERAQACYQLETESAIFLAAAQCASERQLRRFNLVYHLLNFQIQSHVEHINGALQHKLAAMALIQGMVGETAEDEDVRLLTIAVTEARLVDATIRVIGRGVEAMRVLNGGSRSGSLSSTSTAISASSELHESHNPKDSGNSSTVSDAVAALGFKRSESAPLLQQAQQQKEQQQQQQQQHEKPSFAIKLAGTGIPRKEDDSRQDSCVQSLVMLASKKHHDADEGVGERVTDGGDVDDERLTASSKTYAMTYANKRKFCSRGDSDGCFEGGDRDADVDEREHNREREPHREPLSTFTRKRRFCREDRRSDEAKQVPMWGKQEEQCEPYPLYCGGMEEWKRRAWPVIRRDCGGMVVRAERAQRPADTGGGCSVYDEVVTRRAGSQRPADSGGGAVVSP